MGDFNRTLGEMKQTLIQVVIKLLYCLIDRCTSHRVIFRFYVRVDDEYRFTCLVIKKNHLI